MKASTVYLKAAKSLILFSDNPDEKFSCLALERFGEETHLVRYEKIFMPRGGWHKHMAWASDDDGWGPSYTAEGHECRVLALCLMSAIAAFEEKK